MTAEIIRSINKMPTKRLLCVGGTSNGVWLNLIPSVNRVLVTKRKAMKEFEPVQVQAPHPTHEADTEEYTVRRVSFQSGEWIEILGPVDWSDFEVFRHLVQINGVE